MTNAAMKAALDTLGIPTYHWITMVENKADMQQWQDALLAKFEPEASGKTFTRRDWDELLGKYGAITDYPAVVLAEELIEVYPEAKVVLVERDATRWYESYNESVIKGAIHPLIPALRLFDPGFVGMLGRLLDLVTKHYFNVANPRDIEAWRRNAKATYLRHNDLIKSRTPQDRLLLFHPEQGWEPLCTFLCKPVPSTPFPKTNERKDVDERAGVILRRSLGRATLSWFAILAPVVAFTCAFLRQPPG